jgi:hypothetical protein
MGALIEKNIFTKQGEKKGVFYKLFKQWFVADKK